MQLLLWRHAEAEDGDNDMQRALTPRGRRQARKLAAWIHRHAPADLRVLASPAVRAQETAAALKLPFATVAGMSPAADARQLLAAIDAAATPDGDDAALVLVGHQPALGELAAMLLAGSEAPWAIRKGAVWWLNCSKLGGHHRATLTAVMPPALCG